MSKIKKANYDCKSFNDKSNHCIIMSISYDFNFSFLNIFVKKFE